MAIVNPLARAQWFSCSACGNTWYGFGLKHCPDCGHRTVTAQATPGRDFSARRRTRPPPPERGPRPAYRRKGSGMKEWAMAYEKKWRKGQ